MNRGATLMHYDFKICTYNSVMTYVLLLKRIRLIQKASRSLLGAASFKTHVLYGFLDYEGALKQYNLRRFDVWNFDEKGRVQNRLAREKVVVTI